MCTRGRSWLSKRTSILYLHNDYPSAPEKTKTNNFERLIPTLNDKKNYVLLHESLKLYERLGLKITRIHAGIRFRENKMFEILY